MKEIDKIINQIEYCIQNNYYEPVETETIELKPTPPSLKESNSVLQTICAFMNTNGGILLLGIKDNNNIPNKNYEIKGYREDFENTLKEFGKQFTDRNNEPIDLSEYIVGHEIKDFMDKRVCAIYVEKLPDDSKFVFFKKQAYKRLLTGDHEIDEKTIEKHEEFKEEIKNAKELDVVNEATTEDLNVDSLNEYIYLFIE
jgi:ATP-dependent DNA helicase RecG